MAERLTEKDKYGNNAIFQKKDKFTIAKDKNNDIRVYGKAIDKLAQLEDIMERLGINFVEDLEDEVRSLRVDKYIYKKEQDTWKKACELACEREDDCYVYDNIHRAYEFYQQAKTEGNDERN